MNKVEIGDIWLVLIPRVKKNKEKLNIEIEKRPCLIFDDGQGFIIEKNNDYLGAKITTKQGKKRKEIKDWNKIGLRKKSYIRIEAPIKIEQDQLIKKIGKINRYDLYLYLNDLVDYINDDILEKIKQDKV